MGYQIARKRNKLLSQSQDTLGHHVKSHFAVVLTAFRNDTSHDLIEYTVHDSLK